MHIIVGEARYDAVRRTSNRYLVRYYGASLEKTDSFTDTVTRRRDSDGFEIGRDEPEQFIRCEKRADGIYLIREELPAPEAESDE